MSKITVLNEKAIAVEVPEGAEFIQIEDMRDWEFRLSYKYGGIWVHKELDGCYQMVGRPNKITEEQWKGIVRKYHLDEKYEDYFTKQNPDSDLHGCFCPMVKTATESGLSLLKSKGLNPIEVIILIKQ